MTKRFSIIGELKGIESAQGLQLTAYSKKGKKLDSFIFRDDDDFELDFKTRKALKRAKRGKIQLHLEDLNGDAANFTLKNGDEADFEPDTMKKFMKIKKNKGFAKKNLMPSFEVIESPLPDGGGNGGSTGGETGGGTGGETGGGTVGDENGGGTGDGETPPVSQEPNEIRLTGRTNIVTSTRAQEILVNDVREDIGEPLSNKKDIIKADTGDFGQSDLIRDRHSGDGDELHLTTNSAEGTSLKESLDNIEALEGIESMIVTMNNDDGPAAGNKDIWFDRVEGLQSLTIKGTSKESIVVKDHLDAGIREFDFSDLNFDDNSQQGIVFNNNDGVDANNNPKASNADAANTQDKITFLGSKGTDEVEAVGGFMIAKLGRGDDVMQGAFNTQLDASGGKGLDKFILVNNNATDIIRFENITREADSDFIDGFDYAANSPQNRQDILSFNNETYSNYGSGQDVRFVSRDIAQGQNGAQLKHAILRDSFNNINTLNLNTGEGTLAIDDTGVIYFSPDGNFQGNVGDNFEKIAAINNGVGIDNLTESNIQIH